MAITDVAQRDPWEKTNRTLFAISTAADRYALSPVTDAYRTVVPEAPRRGIGNAYDMFQEPTYLANALAQGKVKNAFRAFDRFLVNAALGLGVADHASAMGLTVQKHDFGQTMAVWGVPSGPYLVMPLIGPSTARDGVGFFVDFILDPVDLLQNRIMSFEERLYVLGVRVLDIRSGLKDQGEQLLLGAADPYATTRSAWLQLRRYQIFDGNLPASEEEEDIPPPPGGPLDEQVSEGEPVPATEPDPA